jgi:Skp family chaperone for outer membrane proteins
MVAKTSIYYDIVTEFQNKGAKQAQQSMGILEKSASSLGKKLAATFGAAALLKFGKDAVHMAAEENKQFTILGNTLNNLGLGFASVNSKPFIENLALASGVAIDTLIPAYQQLLVATGDVALSQKDLAIAMDVSIATGKELSAVTTAISKGYLGNTTALSRLGAGLDKALLKTGDMNAIMLKLSSTFAGSTAAAADTAGGAIARLTEASRQATVQIGDGLIGAFTALTAGGSLTNAINDIVKLGTVIGNAIAGIGDLIAAVKNFPIVGTAISNLTKFFFNSQPLVVTAKALAKFHTDKNQPAAVSAGELTGQSMLATQAQAKVTAQRAADAKNTAATLANTKKTTAELKAQAALKALGTQSDDLAKAELLAALQKDVSAEAKLQLQYQLDLLNLQNKTGDALQKAVDDATYLKETVLKAYGLIQLADGAVVNFSTAKDPFAGFDPYLTALLKALYDVDNQWKNITQDINKANGAALGLSQTLLNNYFGTYQPPVGGTSGIAPYANTNPFTYPSAPPSGLSAADLYNTNPFNINISLDQGLIVSTTNAASAAGSQITINRNQNQFV